MIRTESTCIFPCFPFSVKGFWAQGGTVAAFGPAGPENGREKGAEGRETGKFGVETASLL